MGRIILSLLFLLFFAVNQSVMADSAPISFSDAEEHLQINDATLKTQEQKVINCQLKNHAKIHKKIRLKFYQVAKNTHLS